MKFFESFKYKKKRNHLYDLFMYLHINISTKFVNTDLLLPDIVGAYAIIDVERFRFLKWLHLDCKTQ